MNSNTQNNHIKKIKEQDKHKFKAIFLEGHGYNRWFNIQDNEKSDHEESINTAQVNIKLLMPPLEGAEEEVKKRKRNKNLTSRQTINKASSSISTNKSWK